MLTAQHATSAPLWFHALWKHKQHAETFVGASQKILGLNTVC